MLKINFFIDNNERLRICRNVLKFFIKATNKHIKQLFEKINEVVLSQQN